MLLPLLLTLLGALAAVMPAPLGFPDPPDFVPLGLLALGPLLGWLAWRKRTGRGRLALATTQTLLALGLAYWMLGFSAYGAAPGAPRPGDRAPLITATRVRDGARFELAAERGHPVLLVFFRGKW
ncbi:MAG TPA: hypothetical protein VFY93_11170 [Planctomycetota bacterium]|nr:hypothetical protein [Planctomycetota bacterium]